MPRIAVHMPPFQQNGLPPTLTARWSGPVERTGGVAWAGWPGRGGLGGLSQLNLWVTDGNQAARALYERCGFTPTGERQPLPSGSAHTEIGMMLSL